ncbi:20123_t:CDS:1, partial [Gigaspora margarita]
KVVDLSCDLLRSSGERKVSITLFTSYPDKSLLHSQDIFRDTSGDRYAHTKL